ncbi:class I SAM-dependent methyltransferase [Candidatus Shapirobacteria bacterium]|nr:class I SAM-dependent methyltransferase [Candidatus Shapirobacteria bacterium]
MTTDTSWKNVGGWYKEIVGEEGHFYHREVVLPNLLRLMKLDNKSKVLDLGCGQGVLARALPPEIYYWGADMAPNLIEEAKRLDKNPRHVFGVADATKTIPIVETGFSHITVVLALQNLESPFKLMRNVDKLMAKDGRFFIVLNHPAFRIPKNSDWEVDENKTVQYRKESKYMSPLKIAIESSPFDKKNNQISMSYHYPISAYSEMLHDNGMVIEVIEEWVSPKKSQGPMAKIEDVARREFPLFMCIVARKVQSG